MLPRRDASHVSYGKMGTSVNRSVQMCPCASSGIKTSFTDYVFGELFKMWHLSDKNLLCHLGMQCAMHLPEVFPHPVTVAIMFGTGGCVGKQAGIAKAGLSLISGTSSRMA